ncbi:MAG: hypothetical protein V8S75_01075 [[Ruminococcus] torques]
MTRKTNRYKDKEYHYYYCPTGKKNGCTSAAMVKETNLIQCVQDSLKGHIDNVASLDLCCPVSVRNVSTGSWRRNTPRRSG